MLPLLADALDAPPPKTLCPKMELVEAAAGELCALLLPPNIELPPNSDDVLLLAPPKMDPPEAADVAVAGAGEPKPLGLTVTAAAWPKMLPPELAAVAAAAGAPAAAGLPPNGEAAAEANNPVGGAVALTAGAAPNTLASGLGTLPNIFAVGVAAV